MTDLRISTPHDADTLATLVERQSREWWAYDPDNKLNEDEAGLRAWRKTWRQIARSPVVTSADAIAVLSLVEENMEATGSLDSDFGAYPKLFKALRGYIKSTENSR
jgi:hypothetical protein